MAKQKWPGSAPFATVGVPADSGVTASVAVGAAFSQFDDYASQVESYRERVEKWFIRPLKAMKDHDGFIVLMVLLPLYEKHLRFNKGLQDRTFSKDDPILKTMGRDLGISAEEAYQFWRHFRNGVLHRAVPEDGPEFVWAFSGLPKPIVRTAGCYFINPFALRDRLLIEIENGLSMWKTDQLCPLPSVFMPMSP